MWSVNLWGMGARWGRSRCFAALEPVCCWVPSQHCVRPVHSRRCSFPQPPTGLHNRNASPAKALHVYWLRQLLWMIRMWKILGLLLNHKKSQQFNSYTRIGGKLHEADKQAAFKAHGKWGPMMHMHK